VTGYHVQRCVVMDGDECQWDTVSEAPVTDLELVVDHLKPLSRYQFRVAAENQLGIGDFSPPSQTVTCPPELDDESISPHDIQR